MIEGVERVVRSKFENVTGDVRIFFQNDVARIDFTKVDSWLV